MTRLIPFESAHPHSAFLSIEADVQVGPGAIDLSFVLTGDLARIVLPSPAPEPARRDELWRSTCMELFLRGEGTAYAEFNVSPSGDWAAYAFDRYRAGMRDLDGAEVDLETGQTAQRFMAQARISGVALAPLLGTGPWRAGLTAVIADHEGHTSYWALAHPPGKPDFHHEACFALDLAAAMRA